jgi:hypothetical protein
MLVLLELWLNLQPIVQMICMSVLRRLIVKPIFSREGQPFSGNDSMASMSGNSPSSVAPQHHSDRQKAFGNGLVD